MTNPLTEKLRPHVEAVQSAAASGDEGARQIITLYGMHCRCPSDPGAFALCGAATDAWLAKRRQQTVENEDARHPV